MSTLVERMALGHGCQMTDTETGEILACSECKLQAAVVADWMESDEAVEVVAEAQGDAYWSKGSPKSWEGYARAILAALAAHAKGETDE